MSLMRISNNVYNVGVLAPLVRKSGLDKNCKYGTAYNSYFIDDKKTALIDMVYGEYTGDFLYSLGLVADIGAVDYLILNMVHPQQAGSIEKFLQVSPGTVIVCCEGAKKILDNILNMPYNCVVVNNGDRLKLGKSILEFICCENIPSPDSMCTYFENDCVLFSGNMFSTDFCDPKGIDEELAYEKEYFEELESCFNYYLSSYKSGVKNIINTLQSKQVYYIAPAKGLVVMDRVKGLFESYCKWCTANKEKTAVVLYASASGCTRKMAETIYSEFKINGINTQLINMQTATPQQCAVMLSNASYIAAGSCTINKGLPSCVWNTLSEINGIANDNKLFFTFGSYGWSGEGTDLLCARLLQSGMKRICEPIKACMNPTEEITERLKNAVVNLLE